MEAMEVVMALFVYTRAHVERREGDDFDGDSDDEGYVEDCLPHNILPRLGTTLKCGERHIIKVMDYEWH